MASSDPIFGVVTQRADDEAAPAIYADMSTVGICGPAPLADPTTFPLDTPVKFNSDDTRMISLIGESGLITDAIRGIDDQLHDYQRAAQIVFVRTAKSMLNDPALALQADIAAVMGDPAAGTGINAFTLAPQLVHAIPRLLCAPGYTGQLASGVDAVTYNVPQGGGTPLRGAGYVPGQSYPVTFTGGGTGVIPAAGHAIANPDGSLGNVVIDDFGMFYASAPAVHIPAPPTGGTQAAATATIAALANAVTSGSEAVLDALIANMVVESTGTSFANDEAWRQTIQSDRVIAVSGGVKIVDPNTGVVVVRPFAPRAIGCMVRQDFANGGAPFKSAANQPVYGIVGPARTINFNLSSGTNEGQELLADNVGILVSGDVGNDFAIASGGFVAIFTDNCGEDELWRFYNQTRGRDYINLTLIKNLRYYLGRFNITAHVVQTVVNVVGGILRDLKANDNLLGYKISFRGSLNSADEIRKGNIKISFAAEEPTVLRKITAVGSRYRPAVDALVAQLESQLDIAA